MVKQLRKPDVITLDGPAGSGKSSIALELADRLGMDFLDTGAMYRGIAAMVLDTGMDPTDHPAVEAYARRLRIAFDFSTHPPALIIDGTDVTHRLRDADVTVAVSDIACNVGVRRIMVEAQRQVAREHPHLVTEGRDQGSVVFPNAQVKFYLDASPEVRARRRANQLRQMGREADESQILQEIVRRDERDQNRSEGPLCRPEGAIYVDTSDMSFDAVVDTLYAHVARVMGVSE